MQIEQFGPGARRAIGAALLAFAIGVAATANAAAEGIGVAAVVVRDVTGSAGGAPRALGVGNAVFQDETITTARESNAQLLFLDQTSLTIGPSSDVMLDRFVFDGDRRASDFAVQATRGALRFVSGSSKSESYKIRTPVATIGVRGTIVDVFVRPGEAIIILEEGASDVCVEGGRCTGLVKPGTYLVVRAGGQIQGPRGWDGSIRSVIGPVSFPLYGWHLDLDRRREFGNAQQQENLVDQLDALPDDEFCNCGYDDHGHGKGRK
jgi:ferric-dicitrate binding protein FerR (iron transport regulator)